MKNLIINNNKIYCSISKTKIYHGDNNELIYVKVYQGDWGDWDEAPQSNNQNIETSTQKSIYDKIPEEEN